MHVLVIINTNAAINITGNRDFQLGETTTITCSTPVPMQSIQWLDESKSVVREGTSVQELLLDITIVASHSNTEYTCRISFHGGLTASDTITIRTNGKKRALIFSIIINFAFYSYCYKCDSN